MGDSADIMDLDPLEDSRSSTGKVNIQDVTYEGEDTEEDVDDKSPHIPKESEQSIHGRTKSWSKCKLPTASKARNETIVCIWILFMIMIESAANSFTSQKMRRKMAGTFTGQDSRSWFAFGEC